MSDNVVNLSDFKSHKREEELGSVINKDFGGCLQHAMWNLIHLPVQGRTKAFSWISNYSGDMKGYNNFIKIINVNFESFIRQLDVLKLYLYRNTIEFTCIHLEEEDTSMIVASIKDVSDVTKTVMKFTFTWYENSKAIDLVRSISLGKYKVLRTSDHLNFSNLNVNQLVNVDLPEAAFCYGPEMVLKYENNESILTYGGVVSRPFINTVQFNHDYFKLV